MCELFNLLYFLIDFNFNELCIHFFSAYGYSRVVLVNCQTNTHYNIHLIGIASIVKPYWMSKYSSFYPNSVSCNFLSPQLCFCFCLLFVWSQNYLSNKQTKKIALVVHYLYVSISRRYVCQILACNSFILWNKNVLYACKKKEPSIIWKIIFSKDNRQCLN